MSHTIVLKPNVSIIRKNKADQTGGKGIRDMPSGYTMNARPGPEMREKQTNDNKFDYTYHIPIYKYKLPKN